MLASKVMAMQGKTIVYEETFKSPSELTTKGDALYVLEKIRQAHSEADGWVEIEGYVEQLPNGKWRAVRHHVKYR